MRCAPEKKSFNFENRHVRYVSYNNLGDNMCIQPSNLYISLTQCFEQFQNDLYDYFYEENKIEIEVIEKLLIKSLKNKFTQREISNITGLCERTIRNKYKNGFKIIQ